MKYAVTGLWIIQHNNAMYKKVYLGDCDYLDKKIT